MVVEPAWLTIDDVTDIHDEQLATFGGLAGVKDIGLVEGALAFPINLFHYERITDTLQLGVSLCMAIARNHGFVDGNKRTGTASMLDFLFVNGLYLNVPDNIEAHPTLGVWVERTLLGDMTERKFYQELLPFVFDSESVEIDDIAPTKGKAKEAVVPNRS